MWLQLRRSGVLRTLEDVILRPHPWAWAFNKRGEGESARASRLVSFLVSFTHRVSSVYLVQSTYISDPAIVPREVSAGDFGSKRHDMYNVGIICSSVSMHVASHGS